MDVQPLNAVGHSVFGRSRVASDQFYDELFDGEGKVRSTWQVFANWVEAIGPRQVNSTWDHARRIIAANGVTYNVYGDPAGMDRPWNLDPIPLLIDHTQWKGIAAGLVQRALLLDQIIADIYGPQRLLAEGLIPAELIFAHPGFLRPCHGMKVPQGRWLHQAAVDMGRDPQGRIWVIGDRTQAPCGAGYALENRIVTSRVLPEVFRDCQVQRLALFFRDMRDSLKALAPQNKDNPRIVLLTPGPYTASYFEHAYLARYLGFMLVEAGDLTVRDRGVFLKTLGGLQQVDVILRHQNDDLCDSLELRQDSALGVPGLIQAAWDGHVAIASALGSGIAESPALLAFLPSLAKHLLGQDLLLPSVESYWCADAVARQHVLANLSRMVIRPAFSTGGANPVFGATLNQASLAKLAERIQAQPQHYVGHSQMDLSMAPVLIGDHFEPRHMLLRAHVVVQGQSYSVMPGGITRYSHAIDSLVVSMQRGAGSKDTWVLAGGPVDPLSLLQPADQPVAITRAGSDLPSRVADNLFWLGRYVERAEGLIRVARGALIRLTDQNLDGSMEIGALLNILQPAPAAEPLSSEQRLAKVLLDPADDQGLQGILNSIDNIAGIVRDRLSMDVWRIVKRVGRELGPRQAGEPFVPNELLFALDRLIITFAAFAGLAMENMSRGYAWRFLDIGRRIERALHTAKLLKGTLLEPPAREQAMLEATLEITDNSLVYHRRYLTSVQAAPVVDLLVTDETNPRSVGFQLVRLSQHVDSLPRSIDTPRLSPEQAEVLRCLTTLRLLDVQTETAPDATGRRPRLGQLLDDIVERMQAVSDAISQEYLSHAMVSRQLAILSGGA